MVAASPISFEKYWDEIEVTESDLELIVNLLLEREAPLTSQEMIPALVQRRIEELEKKIEEAMAPAVQVYLPENEYSVGETLQFPALDGMVGAVVGIREGENPDLETFNVITVEFEEGEKRDFAAGFRDHDLNRQLEPGEEDPELLTVPGVLKSYENLIISRLNDKLATMDEIVQIAGRWFPKALLVEMHEGHLNLAEAVLDVAKGGPLPTSDLLEHIEVPSSVDPLLAAFSLDYALQEDARFDEVGPAGKVLWHLRRLEPPEVQETPSRLQYTAVQYDRSLLPESLLELELQLDDELSPVEAVPEQADQTEVTISLLFPHWRVGALPLSHRLRPLFPTAYEAPRIRFILVDGHTEDRFPGWVVRSEGYVFGLEKWFRKYEMPAGGLLTVRQGEVSGEVIVEAVDRRPRNDWIRTATLDQDGRVRFTMLKRPIGTSYNEHMVVGLVDQEALDEVWVSATQQAVPLERLVAQVFRELAKLNPQAAVHAQSLYSGVNVLRRLPPGPVFAELVQRPYYEHVGDSYWRFDETRWD